MRVQIILFDALLPIKICRLPTQIITIFTRILLVGPGQELVSLKLAGVMADYLHNCLGRSRP